MGGVLGAGQADQERSREEIEQLRAGLKENDPVISVLGELTALPWSV